MIIEKVQQRILSWNWLLSQEKMKLGSRWIKLDPEFNFYNNLDEIYDANETNDFTNHIDNELDDTEISENKIEIENLTDSKSNYCLDNNYMKFDVREMEDCFKILIPLINYEITAKKINSFDENGYVHNPLYNIQLKKYLENTWWKTVVFWSNLIPAIKDRTRRTTATAEVENNIIKSYDIKKRNLDIDEYLYQRVASISNNQNLVAEKIRYLFSFVCYCIIICTYIHSSLCNYFRFSKPQNQVEEIHDPQEKWDKKIIKLSSLDKLLIDDFNEAYNKRAKIAPLKQSTVANEIIALANAHCIINQSVISKLRIMLATPQNDNDRNAIRRWISRQI